MAGPTVLKPKSKMVNPYTVKGYRPEFVGAPELVMDVPTGDVLALGPRRPASGYQMDTATKAPGAILKPMASGLPDRIRARPLTRPMGGLGGRFIIPNNGTSLRNTNGVSV
jgi:hypothetical protein